MSTTARRLYRALLRLIPREFRAQWAADMEEVLALRLEGAGSGLWSRIRVWSLALVDLLSFAARERAPRQRIPTERTPLDMSGLVQDTRYAWRTLVRSPVFTLVAVATLAVGIGATTATYSVVHPVLVEELPYHDPDRLVVVWPEANGNRAMVELAADEMPSLEQVSGISNWELTLNGAGEPRRLTGTLVSTNHFELLGARPLLGRTFATGHQLLENSDVAILTYGFWIEAFGGDRDVIGRVVELAGSGHDRREIIGVMPADFSPLSTETRVWLPLHGDPAIPLEEDTSWYVNTRIARLAAGATIAQANAEVRDHAARTQRRVPSIFSEEEARAASVRSLAEHRARTVGTALRVAMGAVFLVLLVACANLANLFLARGDRRFHELAVRAALGAGGSRIGRLVVLEALQIGALGGALGVAFAFGLVRLLGNQAPSNFPALDRIQVDGPVLVGALLATLFAAIAASVVPIYRAARTQSVDALAGSARGAAGGHARLATSLIGVQIALALVVTVASGLMVRSLVAQLAVDPGLDPEGVIAFHPTPPTGRYAEGEAYRDYYARVIDRVAALPGVTEVGAIHLLPGTLSNWSFPTYPEGLEIDESSAVPSVNFRAVTIGYFETVRIPLRAGRWLDATDDANAESVVLVNEAFVAQYWPGEDPIGRQLSIFSPEGDAIRVVGVVGNVRQHRRVMDPLPEMYFPHDQVPWDEMSLWVLARIDSANPLTSADTLREAVWSVDPEIPIADMQLFETAMASSTQATRFLTLLLSAFATIALVLGAFGVFGVTSYTVARRSAEFGVRVALGSSRAQILRSAMYRSLWPVGTGIAAGLVGSLAASRWLAGSLFGVRPDDPTTLVTVTVVLGAIAALATLVPALRASRLDPVDVLNSE